MKQRDILFLVISTFVLIAVWIGFSIYHASSTSTIEEPLLIQITAIKPTFDTKTISNLKKREKVAPILESGETAATPSRKSVTPTPTPIVLITPTSTAPLATSAGSLKTETGSGASNL